MVGGNEAWDRPNPAIYAYVQRQQLAREFHQEVVHRENFAQYCHWYRETALANQREYAQMRGDWSLFRWFLRS